MKKLFGLLTTLTISTPISLSVVACGDTSTPTYNSIADGIKSLNLNSFAKVNEGDINSVLEGIKVDVVIGLMKLQFASGVKPEEKKDIEIKVINTTTNKSLVVEDLTTAKTISLKVTVTYNGEDIAVNSATLNVTTKTDQEISDYIKNYDYNSIFKGTFSHIIPNGIPLNVLKTNLKDILSTYTGSFASSFIDDNNLVINTVKKVMVLL